MGEIPARKLRNETRAVLERVEAGEQITITVHGRPVARLEPIDPRPRFMSKEEFLRIPQADRGLRDDLRALLGDETTDDIPIR